MHDLSRLGAWAELPFFTRDLPGIEAALAAETREVLPPANRRFAALETCQPDATRVVILGQDPYPTPGHAHGLAFSVTAGSPLPRSLGNIFREIEGDIGAAPASGDLTAWARQGVLLLNTALSVPAGTPGGHARLGWQRLAEQVLARLDRAPRAFLLWGRPAQRLGSTLRHPDHLVLEAGHPSPLNRNRDFRGCGHFSRVNAWLEARRESRIRWAG